MSEPNASRSPLARLILFICCLAVAAGILAAAHYLVIDLPAQENLPPAPENAGCSTSACELCRINCKGDPDYNTCMEQCNTLVCSGTTG